MSGGLAFASGALALLGLAQLAPPAAAAARARAPAIASLAGAFARAGTEGRDPGAAERRRMLLAGGAAAGVAGFALLGPVAGIALGAVAPYAVGRALRARHERYRRGVEEGAPTMALALADALGGGHSLRGAVLVAARGVPGPAGRELTRVARELELGAPTEEALAAMGARVRSPAIDTVVSAALVQRSAGGDLAGLLRRAALGFEDEARLRGEVRAATAQARFTGVVVAVMPLGGIGLAELASPGFLASLLGSFLSAWLVGLAFAMQAGAAWAIHRLGKVKG